VGNFGIAGCFSFHPRKALTTGEGGMIVTNNSRLAGKLRAMRDHGATESDLQRHLGNKPYLLPEFPYLGYNYRMTDIQASIGCTQMDRSESNLSQRKYWAKKYNEELVDIHWLSTPKYSSEYIHGYQSYVCLFKSEEVHIKNVKKLNAKRNEFMDYLQKRGISTRPGTHAVHSLEYYKQKYKISPKDLPKTFLADQLSIAFPIFSILKEEEFKYIIDSIKSWKII
jgi:dTDP-4-amino-4,6-dideoxygalactose transaminase